jgi:hypothetical protein
MKMYGGVDTYMGMDMSGQLQAHVTLPPGRELPPIPTGN